MADAAVKCWECGSEAPAGDRCRECGRLQPFGPGTDHWGVLGLARRLDLSRAELEARVHELNRRLHPDYFRLRSPAEQAISLESSAAVNTAARILRDPVSRVEYVLEQEGMALGSGGPGRPPADLFEEIMALQEARQELAGATPDESPLLRERLETARADLEARRDEMERTLVRAFPQWDAADEPERGRLLGEMRAVLATRAYLKTILRDLDATLNGGGRTG